jgi:hypothetical protein
VIFCYLKVKKYINEVKRKKKKTLLLVGPIVSSRAGDHHYNAQFGCRQNIYLVGFLLVGVQDELLLVAK